MVKILLIVLILLLYNFPVLDDLLKEKFSLLTPIISFLVTWPFAVPACFAIVTLLVMFCSKSKIDKSILLATTYRSVLQAFAQFIDFGSIFLFVYTIFIGLSFQQFRLDHIVNDDAEQVFLKWHLIYLFWLIYCSIIVAVFLRDYTEFNTRRFEIVIILLDSLHYILIECVTYANIHFDWDLISLCMKFLTISWSFYVYLEIILSTADAAQSKKLQKIMVVFINPVHCSNKIELS